MISTSGSAVTITKADLAITATASLTGNVYRGTAYTGSYTTTAVNSETFTVTGVATGTDVGTYTSALSVSGAALSNYNTPVISNANFVISKANLTLSGSQVYNGGTAVAGSNLTANGVAGQTFTITGSGDATNLTSANIQTASLLNSVTGLTLGTSSNGGISTNYNVISTSGSAVTITKADLGIVLSGTYSGTSVIVPTSYTITGLVGPVTETVTSITSATISDANVATTNKYVTAIVSGGGTANLNNYNITQAYNATPSTTTTNTATLNQAPLGIVLTATYNGNTVVTPTSFTPYGLLGTDSITSLSSATINNANVSANGTNYVASIVINVGTVVLGNYSITQAYNATPASTNTNKVTLTPANLSAVGTKIYDGQITFAGTNLVITGVNSETFTATGSANMNSKNVQASQNLADTSGLTLMPVGSAAVSNYNALNTANTSISVTPLAVVLTAPVINKVYDGGYTYNMTVGDLNNMSAQLKTAGGVLTGDSVSNADVVFAGVGAAAANVGANKTVNLLSATISDGNNGNNYSVTKASSNTSNITPAQLTVMAVNDGRFVTQTDAQGYANNCGSGVACTGGYAGVLYSGFVAGQTAADITGTPVITRSSPSSNVIGNYALTPSGYGANNGNYQITYMNGNYAILGEQNLLVRVLPTTSNYGTPATYNAANVTAQYLAAGAPNPTSLTPSLAGGVFTVQDGAGTSIATFTLGAISSVDSFSNSGNLNAGGYNMKALTSSVSGANFQTMTVVGGTAVNALSLPATSLGVSGVSKVYDGTASISDLVLNTNPVLSNIISGDLVSMKGTGNFVDQNVGVAKSVTINVALSGADANNYFLSSSQLTGNIGTITQLPSVTYISTTAGLWSNSINWANGATPTGNNVGEVIIPVGKTVVYDSALVGTTGSSIVNNGEINFTGSNNFNFSNNVSGTGAINQSGAGTLTVSGNNAGFTGNLILTNATTLLGSLHAISGGAVVSNNGSLGTTTGTTIQSLLVNTPNGIAGSANLQLISDITSNGAQVYNANIILNPSAGSMITLSSNNVGITFNGKIDSPAALASSYSATPNSLTVTAATTIAINDSVGSLLGSDGVLHGLNSLVITAPRIELTADILTKYRQTYTGAVYVGDNGNEGFLLDKYITDVGLNPTVVQNSLDGKNRVNARTLISEDPSVAFVGSINDLTTSGSAAGHNHSLYVAAISHDADASLLDPPTISAGSIGDISRPYSVEFRTLIFGDATPTGTVTSGSITTIAASTLSSSAGLSSIPGSGYPVAPGSDYQVAPGSGGSGSLSGSLDGLIGTVGISGIANNGGQSESGTNSINLGINQASQIRSDQMSAGILQSLILANNNFEVAKMIFDVNSEVSVSMVGGEANFNLQPYSKNSNQLRINPDKTDATVHLDKIEANRDRKKKGDDTQEDDQ